LHFINKIPYLHPLNQTIFKLNHLTMKKLFVVLFVMATGVLSVSAQDAATASGPITSKRGFQILPEAGDWSVSFDAIPVLNYVGNAMSLAGTTIYSDFPSTQAITVRKFNDANNAYRGMVRFDLGSTTSKFNSASDDPAAAAGTTVEDKRSAKNSDIQLGFGIEKRKGLSRVQGIYGAMVMIGKTGSSDKYTYGNAFSATNTTPTSNNFNGNATFPGTRTTETKTSSGFSFGVVGFIGAEYFIAPKLSIGAEFQWGPSFSSNGKLDTTTETWDGATNTVKSTTTTTAGGSSMGFFTNVAGVSTGAINLNFFF
jgi:hypothetical protein